MRVAAYKEKQKDEFEKIESQYDFDLKNLPNKEGFYILQSNKTYQEYYISNTSLLATDNGNPVVFECQKTSSEYCQVIISKDHVVLGISQINRSHIPIQDWPLFYQQLSSLVDDLIVQDKDDFQQKYK